MTKGRNRKKHGNDGQKSKVYKPKFEQDGKGRFYWFCEALQDVSVKIQGKTYVPTCNYGNHPGIVEDLPVCHSRSCGLLRKIKPIKFDRDSRCHSLYKVHTRRDKGYVNQPRKR